MIKLQKIDNLKYEVLFKLNDRKIGDFLMENDGYFYFFPILNGGFWEAHILIEIGNKLNELNKEWDETIQKELGKFKEVSLDENCPF